MHSQFANIATPTIGIGANGVAAVGVRGLVVSNSVVSLNGLVSLIGGLLGSIIIVLRKGLRGDER